MDPPKCQLRGLRLTAGSEIAYRVRNPSLVKQGLANSAQVQVFSWDTLAATKRVLPQTPFQGLETPGLPLSMQPNQLHGRLGFSELEDANAWNYLNMMGAQINLVGFFLLSF